MLPSLFSGGFDVAVGAVPVLVDVGGGAALQLQLLVVAPVQLPHLQLQLLE